MIGISLFFCKIRKKEELSFLNPNSLTCAGEIAGKSEGIFNNTWSKALTNAGCKSALLFLIVL